MASGQFLGGTNLNPGWSAGSSIINLTAGGVTNAAGGITGGGLANNLGALSRGPTSAGCTTCSACETGALLRYFAGVSDANVLSTPNLITLDNEEAKIVVGQNVPIATGSYSNLTSGNTNNAFNTYDRRDVGLTLREAADYRRRDPEAALHRGFGGRRGHHERADRPDLHEALDPVDDAR